MEIAKGPVNFSEEILTDSFISDVTPLLEHHFAEISANPDLLLDPDWLAYGRIQESGSLRIFTARDKVRGDGVTSLVGYAVFIVNYNPHYRSSLQAVQDVLFIDKAHRRGGVGYKFIKWCDSRLESDGVQVVYHHIKAKHNFGKLLERQGYELVDLIYQKRLDGGAAQVVEEVA